MKCYLIVGEASGDLHTSHLMTTFKAEDPQADFRFSSRDPTAAVRGAIVKHYKGLAYVRFIPMLPRLHTIFANMRRYREDIVAQNPDVVILVDYPGFNLNIAKFVHFEAQIPVFYYISSKIQAWREYRIKNIRRDVGELSSILPFGVEFYILKHRCPIYYVGNPTVDEVTAYQKAHLRNPEAFLADNNLKDKPVVALLTGSRKQEIKGNLPDMPKAASAFPDYQLVLAGAPGIVPEYYKQYVGQVKVEIIFAQTYRLLQRAEVALVTSGTATLETALFHVPQVVCYCIPTGRMVSFLHRHILKVKLVSLVDLIVGREVAKELVADTMTVGDTQNELKKPIEDQEYKDRTLAEYEYVADRLGPADAPQHAAHRILELLKE